MSEEARVKAMAAAEVERLMKIDMAPAEEMQGEEDAQAAALPDRCVRRELPCCMSLYVVQKWCEGGWGWAKG